MAGTQSGGRARATTGATTWPVGGAPAAPGHAPGFAGPRSGFFIATKLRQWAAEEVAAAHLLPWLAVAFGFGIVLYFTAEHEPAWWAGTGLAIVSAAGAIALRRHLAAFVAALLIFAAAAGFATATIKTALIAHPVLRGYASSVTVAGFVELREESQHTDRFVLRVGRMAGPRIDDPPLRVGFRSSAASHRRRAPLSRSRRCSIRRCSRSSPVLTISPAIFIFSRSARPALSAAQSM